jgi:acyl carrier protein
MTVDVQELKRLILDATEKQEPAGGLDADEPLFGNRSRLMFDSVDALQISMTIQKRYGVRIGDSKQTRRVMASLNSLATFLSREIFLLKR